MKQKHLLKLALLGLTSGLCLYSCAQAPTADAETDGGKGEGGNSKPLPGRNPKNGSCGGNCGGGASCDTGGDCSDVSASERTNSSESAKMAEKRKRAAFDE